MKNVEYMVIRKVTSKKTGEVAYEPYEVLAASPLEAVETVVAELLPSESDANEYVYGANTVKSISWYHAKTQVVVHMEKMTRSSAKVGEAE